MKIIILNILWCSKLGCKSQKCVRGELTANRVRQIRCQDNCCVTEDSHWLHFGGQAELLKDSSQSLLHASVKVF